jgi:hypothetical protein
MVEQSRLGFLASALKRARGSASQAPAFAQLSYGRFVGDTTVSENHPWWNSPASASLPRRGRGV